MLGGSSGIGKTRLARALGTHMETPWLQVDDLRLALQYSHVILPQHTEDLYFFADTKQIWQRPAEQLLAGLIATSEVLSPAIEIVIANHIDTAAPLIVEGDNILPSLLERPLLRQYVLAGLLQVVFLVESQEAVIQANIEGRARGTTLQSTQELQTEARTKWLYGQWLSTEAQRLNIPIVEARPWVTLVDRVTSTLLTDEKNVASG